MSTLLVVIFDEVKPLGSEHAGHAFTPLTLVGVDDPAPDLLLVHHLIKYLVCVAPEYEPAVYIKSNISPILTVFDIHQDHSSNNG